MSRFDRVYRLLVGQVGRPGIEVTSPIRIVFDLEKTLKEEPNYHTIKVYNLTPDRQREFATPNLRALLYAGYAQEEGALLAAAGAVVDAYSYKDGPDVVTELRVADGFIEIRDTAVSLGYGAGITSSAVLRDVSKQMGLSLALGAEVPDRSWANGFSFYGPARTALHKVTAGAGSEWSVQNQVLQVIARRGVTQRQAFVLASDSGLIGYPERTHQNAHEKAKVTDLTSGKDKRLVSAEQQRLGWRVRSLLLPTINPGDLVKMESRSVTGFYRADKVKHNGDSEGGDWETELELVERNAPLPKKK